MSARCATYALRRTLIRQSATRSLGQAVGLAATGVLLLGSSACGPDPLPPSTLTSETGEIAPPSPTQPAPDESTSMSTPTATGTPSVVPSSSPDLPADSTWIDVTSNLVGLESSCGNVSYVSAHPFKDQLIAGISRHGLWQLNRASGEWEHLGEGAGSSPIVNRTQWIEYDPLAPERFWESGAYGEGLFRTDDSGVSFRQLGTIRDLDGVSTDPTDPLRATMLAGVHERRIVHRSVDSGETWTDIAGSLPPDVGFTAYPLVLDASTHLVGTYRGDDSGVFRTGDGGASWTMVHDGAIAGPPLVVDDTIYWLRENGGGVIVSTDAGASFTSFGTPTGGNPTSLLHLPDGRLATYNDDSVVVSDDDGASWTGVGPNLPFATRGLAYSAEASAFYIWQFTCNFDDSGNPVLPESIMQLGVTLSDG